MSNKRYPEECKIEAVSTMYRVMRVIAAATTP